MVSAMSSQHRMNQGAAAHEAAPYDDGSAHEKHSTTKSVSSRNNIRKRNNTTTATNGEYRLGDAPERKHDGESHLKSKDPRHDLHPFPKSLTPFVHVNDTEDMDAALAVSDVSTRSLSPLRKGVEPNKEEDDDIEAGKKLHNTTISYNAQQPDHEFHASNLSTDSFMDFNQSKQSVVSNDGRLDPRNENSRLFDDLGQAGCSSRSIDNKDEKKGKTRLDHASIESDSVISFRNHTRSSYDSENGDEQALSDNAETDAGSSTGPPRRKQRLWLAKIQQSRRVVGKCVNNEFVQLFIIILIVANAILMGVQTTEQVRMDDNLDSVIDTVDEVFLWIFTIKIAAQLYYFMFALFLDWWLVFDLVVVLVSHGSGQFQVFRSFRIFRAFRLITRVTPLRNLVLALGEVLPRMSAIVALLLVTFYVFAVLFTELYSEVKVKSYPDSENELGLVHPYFSSLPQSWFTCFQMMTMEWSEICRELMPLEKGRLSWLPIVCFVMLAGFIVFNLIVAVVVEAVATTEETVRQLDGIESNSPAAKLAEAQERVDLLQSHLTEMMEQQEQIQFMLETMAGELLHLETERMKAKYRESRLKEEINRRIEYQKKLEEEEIGEQKPANDAIKKISMQFLQKIEASKVERKQNQAIIDDSQSMSDKDSARGSSSKKKKINTSWIAKPSMVRDGSGKSLGTNESTPSARSVPDQMDSPLGRSTHTRKKSESRDTSRKGKEDGKKKESESTRTDDSDQKKRAINNWKKLIAVNKDLNL